jgi:septum formation protein
VVGLRTGFARHCAAMLLLASRSPQRALLLTRAGIPFRVVASRGDEESVLHPDPAELALARARFKAESAEAADAAEGDIALGADTVVALGGRAFGKPSDRADAERMLATLQNSVHTVFTGHACVRLGHGGVIRARAHGLSATRVTMRAMSLDEIQAYVASGESDGRAGAYAIQESGDRFVERIDGPWDTVVGLHIEAVRRLMTAVAE